MFKKFTLLAVILLTISSMVYSKGQKNYDLPFYLKADFFEKYPDFWKYPIFGKLKHYDTPPEVLKHVPEKTRLQSNDGVDIVNISGAPVWTDAQTETWMAINPANPKNLIATANDNVFLGGYQGYKMSAFVTKDGGKSWKNSPTPTNNGYWIKLSGGATIFDPAITFDSKGNCYYAYGFAETKYDSPNEDKNKNGVFVVKSSNGGDTWDALSKDYALNGIVAITNDAFGASGNPFHDRYTIACDISPTSKYKDRVYITWRVFRGVEGIVFSSTSDGGNTWSPYYKIADGGQGPMPTTGPDGEIYVTWIDATIQTAQSRAMFARSTNGGLSFDFITEAQLVTSVGTLNTSNYRFTFTDKSGIRTSSYPQIACDISNASTRGNIYIVQSGRESADGPYGIYVSKSTNKGSSWRKKIRVDGNTLRNDMFFPSISVDPVSGMISVFYYSSQNDSKNNGVDGYVAISLNGGDTWKQIRVTEETKYLNQSNSVFPQGASGGVYWGDYTSIVSYDRHIYPLYWMPTMGNEFGSNDLFTAFLSPSPSTIQNLAATSLFDTKVKVKLTWTNPKTNLFGESLANLTLNILRDGVAIGTVPGNAAPEFIDENIVDGRSYTYSVVPQTDDVKGASTDITILAGGNPKPNIPTDLSWRPATDGFTLKWKNPSKMIDGTDIRDVLKLNVYDLSTNKILTTLSGAQIQAGTISNLLVTAPTKKFYKINVKSVALRGTVETESDYQGPEMIVYSGDALSNMNETFDDAGNSVARYSTGAWGISTAKAASAPNCITDSPTGNYAKNDYSYTILPPFIVTPSKSTLSFDQIVLVDTTINTIGGSASYDYADLAYSKDFGKTWNFVKWMNSRHSSKFILGDLANSQFENLAISFAKNINDTIMLKFAISSNNFKENDGWFIDNITFDTRPAAVDEQDLVNKVSFTIYPNPVSANVTMMIGMPQQSVTGIQIYDNLGNVISEIESRDLSSGSYSFNMDLSNFADGVYYCRLNVNGKSITKPIVIRK